MNCTEIVSASGNGTWYLPYEVSLAQITRQYRNRYPPPQERTIVKFELRFRKAGEPIWEQREFDSDAERATFIQQAFSEITLISGDNPSPTACQHLLAPIVGEQLSAITFVMGDYIQIQFNDHHFNAYAWPIVWTHQLRYAYGEAGYRDAICSLISKPVIRFEEYLDAGLVFEFGDDNALEIPITDPTGEGFEVTEYQGPDGVWRVWL